MGRRQIEREMLKSGPPPSVTEVRNEEEGKTC